MFAARRMALSAVRAPRALPVASPAARFISSTAPLRASGPPIIQGEGAKPGEVATDEQQATGLERFELLGKLQGVDVFDLQPLDASRLGTTKNPIMVKSYFPDRVIGCTGSPAGSHDTIWLQLTTERQFARCPECGSVHALDYQGVPGGDDHH